MPLRSPRLFLILAAAVLACTATLGLVGLERVSALDGVAVAGADSPEGQAQAFLNGLLAGKVRESYQPAFDKACESLKSQTEALDNLITQTEKMFDSYGKPVSAKLARTTRLTDDLVQLQYLVKTPKYPFLWSLTYYRATDKFELINLKFTGDLKDALGQ